MSDTTAILFVELEEWERKYMQDQCSPECHLFTVPTRLETVTDPRILAETVVLSPFVHSKCSAEALAKLPNLRAIATRSTGYDHIDLAYCRGRDIIVCNVPRYGDNTVAEHTFALILALTRKIHRCYERTVRGDFSLAGLQGTDLQGKTFGCLGTGNIGLHALRIARGFDMRRLAFDIYPKHSAAQELGFEYVDLDTLLRQSDIVSLHLPYTPQTHHLIDAAALARMKPGTILVNTARGPLVDSQALINALRSGHLGGAALDVLEAETAIGEEAELLARDYDVDSLRAVVQNHALLRMENVIITPHVAFNSKEAVMRILSTTVQNIHGILHGQPRNVVAG